MFKSKSKMITPDEYLQQLNDQTLSIVDEYTIFNNFLHETDPVYLDVYQNILENPPQALNNRPIMNFRGEVIDQALTEIPKHLVMIEKKTPTTLQKIKELLYFALNKYYTYNEMLKELLSASKQLEIADEFVNNLQNQIWNDNPSITYVKPILLDIVQLVPDNIKQNYLYWYLFTPDFISQNFPTIFHTDMFIKLVELLGKDSAVLLLYQAVYQQLQKPIHDWADYPKEYLTPLIEALELVHTSYTVFLTDTYKSNRRETLNEILKLVTQADNEQFLQTFDPSQEDTFNEAFIEFWKGHMHTRMTIRKILLELIRFEGDTASAQSLLVIEMAGSLVKSRIEQITLALKELIEKHSLERWQPVYLDVLLEALEWQFYQVFENAILLDEIASVMEQINNEISKYFNDNSRISRTDPLINFLEMLRLTFKEAINRYSYRKSLFLVYQGRAQIRIALQKREETYQKYDSESLEKRLVDFNSFLDLIQIQKSRITKLMFSMDQEKIVNFFSRLEEALIRIVDYPMYSIKFIPRLGKLNSSQRIVETFNYSSMLEQKLIAFYRTFDRLLEVEEKIKRYNSLCFRRVQGVLDIINDFITNPTIFDFIVQYINYEPVILPQ